MVLAAVHVPEIDEDRQDCQMRYSCQTVKQSMDAVTVGRCVQHRQLFALQGHVGYWWSPLLMKSLVPWQSGCAPPSHQALTQKPLAAQLALQRYCHLWWYCPLMFAAALLLAAWGCTSQTCRSQSLLASCQLLCGH